MGISYNGDLENDLAGEKQMEYIICESSNNSVVLDAINKNDSSENPFH